MFLVVCRIPFTMISWLQPLFHHRWTPWLCWYMLQVFSQQKKKKKCFRSPADGFLTSLKLNTTEHHGSSRVTAPCASSCGNLAKPEVINLIPLWQRDGQGHCPITLPPLPTGSCHPVLWKPFIFSTFLHYEQFLTTLCFNSFFTSPHQLTPWASHARRLD